MRPIIGIPCFGMVRHDTGRAIYASNRAYVQAVLHAGGAPILIPPLADESVLEVIQDQLDGLLLAGGADLDPALYGENSLPECYSPEPERDAMELSVAHWALDHHLPVFGVCRGMQLLNVACGGSLYQHIPVECPDALDHEQPGQARNHIAHEISVQADSLLGGILGDLRPGVNSFHHQAVHQVGRGFRVTASAEDGIIEAMEMPEASSFVLAVQYHPEELEATDMGSHRLFLAFVQAAADYQRATRIAV
jgi:putative glutamine amidotransferase